MTRRWTAIAGVTVAASAIACSKGTDGAATATARPSLAAVLEKVKLPAAPVEDDGECTAEHPGGCKAAAKKLRATEPAKAVALFTIGCDGGSSGSCVDLGTMRLDGEDGGPKDGERARELYTRACAAQNPWGCNNLGVLLQERLMVDADLGAQAFAMACDGDVMAACHSLGHALLDGKGIEADLHQAEKLFRKACDAKLARSCTSLARLVREGRVSGADLDYAALFQKACDLNDGDGCAYAGVAHLLTPPDAIARFEKGCSLRSAAACAQLADYFGDGNFVPKDPARAIAADDKACALGAGGSCVRARQARAASSAAP